MVTQRKIACLLALTALFAAACAAPTPPPVTPPVAPPAATLRDTGIVGTWQGTSIDGLTVIMTFRENGVVTIADGVESNNGTYRVDLDAQPGLLDIQGPWLGDAGILTIIEAVGPDSIRVENNSPGSERPAVFSSSAVLFRRQ